MGDAPAQAVARKVRQSGGADCLDCGWVDHTGDRRLAIDHARRNPGHPVHFIVEEITIYQLAPETSYRRGVGDCPICGRLVGTAQTGNPPTHWVAVAHGPFGNRCPGSGRVVDKVTAE